MHRTVSQKRPYTDRQIYLGIALQSVVVTFILEILNRGSALSAFRFLTERTVPFLCNALILFTAVSISRLFGRRRRFFAYLIMLVWLIFGIVNAIVLRYRMTPFSAEDFSMIPSLLRIAKNYLTPVLIAVIIAAAAGVIALIVFMWLRVSKAGYEGRFLMILGKTSIIMVGAVIMTRMCINAGLISNEFENLASAYDRYGFAYCFVTSIVDVGISRPDGYSQEMMNAIAENIRTYETIGDEGQQDEDGDQTASELYTDLQPNIIMIQLESFFDPLYLKGFRYSQDPIPCFRQLREDFESGFLTVPVVGAGTSNTEFEILTGMSTDYFGAGEYPYNTILTERSVEALPQILRQYGYISTAIHNNTGTFYNRDTVFSGMGFDAFIPSEYMYDLEPTPNNWVKDKVLTQIMLDVLQGSSKRDFIYTITVQSHGRYPQERVLSEEERVIRVTPVGGEISVDALEYYVNQIHEVDQMVEALTAALSSFEEPTVLVMYGDHLPALGFGAENLKNGDLYETEYVIWNNFGMTWEDEDIESEQIGTRILKRFGMTQGIAPRFHLAYESEAFMNSFGRKKDYRDCFRTDLEALEYDMLYGDGWIFREFADDIPAVFIPSEDAEEDGEVVSAHQVPEIGYLFSKLRIGYRPIRVRYLLSGAEYLEALSSREESETDASETGTDAITGGLKESIADDALIVTGSGFNESSRIMVDNKPRDTILLGEDALMLKGDAPEENSVISVGQFDENLKLVGSCVNLVSYPQLGRPPR